MLSRIVPIETGWQGFDANLGVANVVLNRVKSTEFPDSIYDVIFDTQYSVQFPTAFYDNFAFLEPTTQSIIAAKMALEGINNIGESLFLIMYPLEAKVLMIYMQYMTGNISTNNSYLETCIFVSNETGKLKMTV